MDLRSNIGSWDLACLPAYPQAGGGRSEVRLWLPSTHPITLLNSPASSLLTGLSQSYYSVLFQPTSSSSSLPSAIHAQLPGILSPLTPLFLFPFPLKTSVITIIMIINLELSLTDVVVSQAEFAAKSYHRYNLMLMKFLLYVASESSDQGYNRHQTD